MLTTIELPEDLLLRARQRAEQEGRDLAQLIAQYVEVGLQSPVLPLRPFTSRSLLPVVRLATAQPLPALTSSELHELLEAEDVAELSH